MIWEPSRMLIGFGGGAGAQVAKLGRSVRLPTKRVNQWVLGGKSKLRVKKPPRAILLEE
jgi:hypothetical protein